MVVDACVSIKCNGDEGIFCSFYVYLLAFEERKKGQAIRDGISESGTFQLFGLGKRYDFLSFDIIGIPV